MSDSSKAVFLSYASQDAEAARRICEALRAAGVEVWFDQSELVGGDAWDAKIRKQIKECALFVPIVSANTQARLEGYFRIEWKLAAQRTHAMAHAKTFLLPVVIDDTRDAEAHVPEEFCAVQWTRLRQGYGGQAPDDTSVVAFRARVAKLLGLAVGPGADRAPAREGDRIEEVAARSRAVVPGRRPGLQQSSRRWLVASLAGVALAVAAVIWQPWKMSQDPRVAASLAAAPATEPVTAISAPLSAAIPPVNARSVAVLPFTSAEGDRESATLADDIAEELLYVLAKVPGLQVPARTSAFHFKGRNVPVPEVARQLGVAHVVEGSVRRRGSVVRITVQLIKAVDGFRVWGENFERDAKDALSVQDEIALEIARSLSVTLGEGPRNVVPTNLEAHRLYLEGRHFWSLRTEEGFVRSETALRRALELDPKFARAHAALADLLVVRGWYHLEGNEAVVPDHVQAGASALRALELDPTLAEPHAVLGVIALVSRQAAEAERLFLKTLTLAPNYATAHNWLAELRLVTGRLDQALDGFRRAAELDPLAPVMLNDYGKTLLMARRPAEGLAILEREQALNPDAARNGVYRARALEALGRRDEALATIRPTLSRILAGEHTYVAGEAVHTLRRLRQGDEARTFAAAMQQRLAPRDATRGFILAALGDFGPALPALERRFAVNLEQEFWHEMFDPIREDPRFAQLIARLGCEVEYRTARTVLATLQREAEGKR